MCSMWAPPMKWTTSKCLIGRRAKYCAVNSITVGTSLWPGRPIQYVCGSLRVATPSTKCQRADWKQRRKLLFGRWPCWAISQSLQAIHAVMLPRGMASWGRSWTVLLSWNSAMCSRLQWARMKKCSHAPASIRRLNCTHWQTSRPVTKWWPSGSSFSSAPCTSTTWRRCNSSMGEFFRVALTATWDNRTHPSLKPVNRYQSTDHS